MNHPSQTWKSRKTRNLLSTKSTQKILDRNIRFRGLRSGDELDHQRCCEWEIQRTKIFLQRGIEIEGINKIEAIEGTKEEIEYAKSFKALPFPFYVKTFPQKAYLDHKYEIRKKWTLWDGEETKNVEDDLLSPFDYLDEDEKPCITKLPLNFILYLL